MKYTIKNKHPRLSRFMHHLARDFQETLFESNSVNSKSYTGHLSVGHLVLNVFYKLVACEILTRLHLL